MSKPGPVEKHLRAMRELLSDESKWTQGTLARSDKNRPCKPCSEKAVCWCIAGAAHKTGDPLDGWWVPILDVVVAYDLVPTFNDALGRTFTDVADALDRSIALAAERGV